MVEAIWRVQKSESHPPSSKSANVRYKCGLFAVLLWDEELQISAVLFNCRENRLSAHAIYAVVHTYILVCIVDFHLFESAESNVECLYSVIHRCYHVWKDEMILPRSY